MAKSEYGPPQIMLSANIEWSRSGSPRLFYLRTRLRFWAN